MNKLSIIGNLVRDPEMNTTSEGKTVCNFTVAVSRRKKIEGQPDADFFRVAAWGKLGENCKKYLNKGRKVAVVGPVSCRSYTDKDGNARASLEVFAEETEFLSSGNQNSNPAPAADPSGGTVVDTDELPF